MAQGGEGKFVLTQADLYKGGGLTVHAQRVLSSGGSNTNKYFTAD